MSPDTTNKVLEVAQAYIVSLEAPQWLKKGLQEYSNKASFMGRVTNWLDQWIIEERAVEIVLDEYAKHLWMEYVE